LFELEKDKLWRREKYGKKYERNMLKKNWCKWEWEENKEEYMKKSVWWKNRIKMVIEKDGSIK
jgi:hypothetical protein